MKLSIRYVIQGARRVASLVQARGGGSYRYENTPEGITGWHETAELAEAELMEEIRCNSREDDG